jgi:hypothetical protein
MGSQPGSTSSRMPSIAGVSSAYTASGKEGYTALARTLTQHNQELGITLADAFLRWARHLPELSPCRPWWSITASESGTGPSRVGAAFRRIGESWSAPRRRPPTMQPQAVTPDCASPVFDGACQCSQRRENDTFTNYFRCLHFFHCIVQPGSAR